MKSRATIVFALSFFLFTTGCLDALRNSSDSNEFWGEDCKDLSEEICPSGKAPDFSLIDQDGNPVNLTLYENKIVDFILSKVKLKMKELDVDSFIKIYNNVDSNLNKPKATKNKKKKTISKKK